MSYTKLSTDCINCIICYLLLISCKDKLGCKLLIEVVSKSKAVVSSTKAQVLEDALVEEHWAVWEESDTEVFWIPVNVNISSNNEVQRLELRTRRIQMWEATLYPTVSALSVCLLQE